MSNVPETPVPANEHKTTSKRVATIAAWLVEGKLRPECVADAMQEWQVSRRIAQVYVARAAARIVRATTFEDPLFAIKLSQVQRDKLHQELQELLRKGEFIPLPHWQMKLKTIQADLKLLDSRDRTAAKLLQAAGNLPPPPRKGTAKRPRPSEPNEPRNTLRDPAPHPAPSAPQPLQSPLRKSSGAAGKQLRDNPREKTRPESAVQPNRLVPTLVDAARVALAKACAETTESIAIVPRRPKGKADKAMRLLDQTAPSGETCALGAQGGGDWPASEGRR